MSYSDTLSPLRRRIILEYLQTRPDGEASADVLVSVINGTRDGVTAYYSEVVEDLRWLQNKGYLKVAGDEIVVCEITLAGERIANRQERDPGIADRRPGV